jgi:hypothetical protein
VTKRDFQKLIKNHLLPALGPGYASKGPLVFWSPVQLVLIAYAFEGSSFSAASFNVVGFAQPLYAPSDDIYFNFGKRLGQFEGGQDRWWDLSAQPEEAAAREIAQLMTGKAREVLDALSTPAGFAAKVGLVHSNLQDPYRHEAAAYSLILAGQVDEARRSLLELEQVVRQAVAGGSPWAEAIGQRGRTVAALLAQDPDEARRQLLTWTRETAVKLKLGEFLVPDLDQA